MSKNFSTNDFRDYLREEVVKVCEKNNLNIDNHTQATEAFDLWLAGYLKENNRYIDTEPDDAVIGGKGDLRVDVHLEDETNKITWLIQTQFTGTSSKSPKKNIEEKKVSDFFGLHENLNDPKWVKKYGNKTAVHKLFDYHKDIKDPQNSFKFWFVSTGHASDRVKAEEEKWNKYYEKNNLNIVCQILDFSKFKDFCNKAKSIEASVPESVTFNVPKEKMFTKKSPNLTVVASVKANEIENLYKKEQDGLFAYNIRTYLGEKGINKDIVKTAEDEPENFFYYNNGISAVCTKLHIKGNKLTAEKFQIINGAQTVGALRFIKDDPNLEILIRVTETKSYKTESGINEKIIRFNNTQNKITLADFRSNDTIQKHLHEKFSASNYKITGKINYMRKRGDRFQRKGILNIKLEDLAKIKYAFLNEPCTVISNAKSLWKIGEDGKYNISFGDKDKIITDPDFEKKYMLPIVFYYHDILPRCGEDKKDNEELMYLKRFRFHFLYFYKKMKDAYEKKNNVTVNIRKLLNDKQYLENFTEEIYLRIKDKIVDLFEDERAKNKYQNAPIRDMTINKDHLERLERKILSSIPKIKL